MYFLKKVIQGTHVLEKRIRFFFFFYNIINSLTFVESYLTPVGLYCLLWPIRCRIRYGNLKSFYIKIKTSLTAYIVNHVDYNLYYNVLFHVHPKKLVWHKLCTDKPHNPVKPSSTSSTKLQVCVNTSNNLVTSLKRKINQNN